MLFGAGQSDMAHFAADRPLLAPPGTRFNYSSGTSNIVSGIVARTVGPGEDYARFLHRRLFGPLGMTSADPEFDEAGTWVASSFLRACARDYARFGLLYLRDGMWDGARVLPSGWVDYGRTMVSIDDPSDPSPYGAHWLGVRGETLETLNPLGTFRASGYEGQTITLCPALDLMLVRLGKTPHDNEDLLVPWRAAVVEAFARAAR
jgi:CubicO group peptidase (beta-lactamase class C family)